MTPDTLYVYPTALKAGSVLRERARGAGCVLAHRVTTFPELADALARDLGVTPRVLEADMAAVVLARAVEAPGIPETFRARRRGLLVALLRVMGEFEAAYLAPDDVAGVAASLPAGAAATRLGELGRVYAAYAARLADLGAVDRHGREWRVCEGLAAAEAAGRRPRTLAGVRRIVFAEIYDFSVVQFLIATSLVRLVGDAELVAFAHPENVDATRFLDRTWNRFVGDPAIADQVLPSFVVRGGRSGNLAAALRGVFAADRPPPVPPDGSVTVLVAPDRYREVEAAVRDIRVRLERGEPPGRMALLARDLAVYRDLIEDVCRRYRVPVYFRKGQPLLGSGVVQACLNVLRCALEGLPRPRLEEILDTDYLGVSRSRLARVLRRVGFVSETARPLGECVAHWRAALAAQATDGRLPAERQAAAAQEAAGLERDGAELARLVGTLRTLEGRRPVAAHVRALRRALRSLGLRAVPRGALLPPSVRRDARAWELLQETLALLAGLARRLGLAPMPLADFVGLLLAALEPLDIDDRAEPAGSVRALSVLDARGLDFDTVYLLGLDDGTFPAPRAESPLWPDAMKRAANPAAAAVLRKKLGARAEGLPLGGLWRTAREASLEDPFLFFLALSMAERQIVLSFPAGNESGNPTVPSPFIDEVQACTEGPLPERRLDPTSVVPPAAECCELGELVGRAALERWSRAPAPPPARFVPALREARPDLARRLAAIDHRAGIEERRSRYFLTAPGGGKEALADAFVGRLAGDLGLLASRLATMRWSPHRLEALGTCGFKFWARDLLGLGEEREPEAQVGAMERGTLVHYVLERLFGAHPDLPADPSAARVLARAFVRELRDEVARIIPAKEPGLFDVTWRQIAAAVDALVERECEERPRRMRDGIVVERLLEKPLDCTLGDPAGGSPLALSGRPDRVDVLRRDGTAVGLRVLDYKMTRDAARYAALLDPSRELGKTAFQIPVYLLGALASVPQLAADATLEGEYVVLLGEGSSPVRAFTRELLDEMAARVRELVARARAGRFDVDPAPCDPYCAYRPVCRYRRPPLEEEPSGG